MIGAPHRVAVMRRVHTEPDSYGRTQYEWSRVLTPRARVASLRAREKNLAASFAQDSTVVVTVALGTDVWLADRIVVDGVSPHLDGDYAVATIEPTAKTLRIFCRRTDRD